MFGGLKRLLGLIATITGLCLLAVNDGIAQSPPYADDYAPVHNMPPVVSAASWPVAQPLAMPIDPTEGLKPRRSASHALFAPLFGRPAESVQQVSACSDCGGLGSNCRCSSSPVGFNGRSAVSSLTASLPSLACDGRCGVVDCAGGCRQERISFFYEYLYLRARNADVAYAVPIDGPIEPTDGNGIQIGPVAVVGMDYDGTDSYRLGGSLLLNDGAQIGGRYTTFDNKSASRAFQAAPDVLRSLITHPLGDNAATDSSRASANYQIEFEMADLFYQAHLFVNQRTTLDYVLGLRYAEINQRLNANFNTTGETSVDTDVEFYGFGPRIGMALDHRLGGLGLKVYSHGDATFIPGTAKGFYTQSESFGGLLVDTSWESGCIMTQLDFEIGVGWQLGNSYNISAGYLVSAWLNTATTTEFINAVQTNDFDIGGDGLTFDGLVLRSDLRF